MVVHNVDPVIRPDGIPWKGLAVVYRVENRSRMPVPDYGAAALTIEVGAVIKAVYGYADLSLTSQFI